MASQADTRRKFIAHNPGVKRRGKKGMWYRCAHCGKWCGRAAGDNVKIKSDDMMEVDHIRPWSKGGSDEVYNLQPLCRPCNRSKSNDMTFKDNLKTIGNSITHPVDSLAGGFIRESARNSKILKGLGITKRK